MQTNPGVLPVTDTDVLASSQGPMIILWTIRQHGPLNFNRLFELIYVGEHHAASAVHLTNESHSINVASLTRVIVGALRRLVEAGLIKVNAGNLDGLDKHATFKFGEALAARSSLIVEATPNLAVMQELFGFSLTRMAISRGNEVMIEPSFGKPRDGNWADIFVVMPFSDVLRPIYEDQILPTVRSLGLTCKRGDDFFSDDAIVDDVWSAIYAAKLCICDCTGRNPNVFYEMGIAHTLGRPTILIAQTIDDIPFDIRHRRIVVYQNTPDALQKFRDTLTKAIHAELKLHASLLQNIFARLDGQNENRQDEHISQPVVSEHKD